MFGFGPVSWPYLIIEGGEYILTALVLRHAWRKAPYLFMIVLSAILFGFLVEYLAVTNAEHPYHYNYFIIKLPGPIPLEICLGWGIIFYSVMLTAEWVGLPWRIRPIFCGLLAVGIDFALDPIMVAMNFWTWALPPQWFGIPWGNFTGWFVVVITFTFMHILGYRWFPPGSKGLIGDFLVAFIAIIPSFCVYLGTMLVYEGIVNSGKIPEELLVAIIFGSSSLLVLSYFSKFKRNNPVDWMALAVPLYLYACSIIPLFLLRIYEKYQELVVVVPALSLLGIIWFITPYAYTLFPQPDRNGKTAPGKWFSFDRLPWLLLVLVVAIIVLSPKKELIGPVNLPKDDAFLAKEPIQWWYWTGHLETVETEEPRHYGFEIVFFAFKGFDAQLAQTAITDVTGDGFHFKEYVHFSLPKEVPNQFDLAAGPINQIMAKGGNGKDSLHTEVDGYVLDLAAESIKAPVLHYGGNSHPFIYGGNTYYYSREKMAASGALKIGDKTYKVKGTAWFDRQYGELYQAIVKGWNWFAIELDDGREIMLYDYRGKYADVERYGSVTGPGNQTRDLGPNDYKVEKLGEWKSPHTGCTYPMGWNITIGDMKLKVEPLVVDQELRAQHHFWAGPEYWEGASGVSGDVKGKAYVELNGYCRGVEGTVNVK